MDWYDLVRDIMIRFKDTKRIYAYEHQEYWANIATVESYYQNNMDFLKPELRKYFFNTYPGSSVTSRPRGVRLIKPSFIKNG